MALKAIALNLHAEAIGGEPSSTDRMIGLVAAEFEKHGSSWSRRSGSPITT